MAHGWAFVVPAAQHATAVHVTRRTVSWTTLPLALVSAAGPGLVAFGLTEIFLMTRQEFAVTATSTGLFYFLSAGLTGSSVAAH